MILYETILPIELTNGNDGRGSKWFSSANVRKKIEKTLRQLGMVREPFNQPVKVTVTRIIGKGQRMWDTSSVGRGNWKEIEDAMVVCGWFHDDCPQWITATTFRQDGSQRHNGPAIKVTIEQHESEG